MAPRKFPPILRDYERWTVLTEPGSWGLTRMRNTSRRLDYRPKVSILLPVYEPDRSWLVGALDSVMAQTYPFWELCICDDGSKKEHVRETLDLYGRVDKRIKVKHLEKNENIVSATNHALSLATGEFVGLLDHDDALAPHALFEMVRFLQEHRDADLVYSDEDKIDEAGERINPHFKIGWSQDLAMEANYLCHFSVYRRTLLEDIGGWREGFDGAQDLELVQRVGEKTDKIHHLSKILYHWRMVTGSTAVGAEGKPYTHEKARRAIQDSLERQGVSATVEDSTLMPNTFRVRREVLGEPRVSVIVTTAGDSPDRLIQSLHANTSYKNHEVLVLNTNKATLTGQKGTKQLEGSQPAELRNAAARQTDGEYVVFLDSDLEAVSGEWLDGMLQHAQRPEVGAVGGKLSLPSGEVFQAGLALTGESGDGHPAFYRNCDRQTMGYDLYFALNRNCGAVSSGCMMFRKDDFEEVGGFDDIRFDDAFADVDLCLKMREQGHLIVFTPYADFLYHGAVEEPSGLGTDEANYVRQRWGGALAADPYHSPNLLWDPEDLSMIRSWPRSQPSKAPQVSSSGQPSATPAPASVGTSAPAEPRGFLKPRKYVEPPPPFFIVGHGRSGTTWLELTLNTHPEVVCKGSGMFFGRGMPLFESQRTLPNALLACENLRVWHDMRPNYWSERSFEEDLSGLVKAISNRTMGTELAESGKKIAGDRTPHHVSYLDELHALYPEAKMIHIIRDGRDVAISNLHAFWQNALDRGGPVKLEPEVQQKRDAYLMDRAGFIARGESIFTEQRIDQLAKSWKQIVDKGRKDGWKLFGDRYVEVRYEDLLEDPHAELDRLFTFLEVDRDPDMVAKVVEENRFEKVTGRPRGQEDSSHFNRKGVAGDWKEVFTKRDRRVFEDNAGELLVELGYEKDNGQSRPSHVVQSVTKVTSSLTTSSSKNYPPPFFVVGHGRSGTTWTERLLNSHPEVLCIGSGMFFGRTMGLFEGRKTLYSALYNSKELRIWHDMQLNYWSPCSFEEDLPGFVQSISKHVLYEKLTRSGKKIVGDRTPHDVFYLDETKGIYPDAKVIHVVRDGRDVAISNLHAFWNSARDRGGPVDLKVEELRRRDAYFENRESFLSGGESIFTEQRISRLAKSWNQAITKGHEDGHKLFGENYLEIRYENLLENPEPELERMFAFLDVTMDSATIVRVVDENRFEKRAAGRSRGEEDSTSFLRKGIHGDWKEIFNARDKKLFKRHAGDLLVALGYEEDLSW